MSSSHATKARGWPSYISPNKKFINWLWQSRQISTFPWKNRQIYIWYGVEQPLVEGSHPTAPGAQVLTKDNDDSLEVDDVHDSHGHHQHPDYRYWWQSGCWWCPRPTWSSSTSWLKIMMTVWRLMMSMTHMVIINILTKDNDDSLEVDDVHDSHGHHQHPD